MKPTYQKVIDFYLRDDISAVFWAISNTRRLRFYYDAVEDIRQPGARKLFRFRLRSNC